MAADYARALDAYELARRETTRNPAEARRALDDGLGAYFPSRGEAPWEHRYAYTDPQGRRLQYGRGAPNGTVQPLPSRKVWHIDGDEPELRGFWAPLLSLLLLPAAPLFLIGCASVLAVFPGLLIYDVWWN